MTTPQLLAISVGVLEIIAGLMIALNFGARFFAMLMVIYIAVVDRPVLRFLESGGT